MSKSGIFEGIEISKLTIRKQQEWIITKNRNQN
jgi:hypothetical protein